MCSLTLPSGLRISSVTAEPAGPVIAFTACMVVTPFAFLPLILVTMSSAWMPALYAGESGSGLTTFR
jgi:hypothetical protein